MKFVVTGGAGFIGSNIVKELVNLGHSIKVIDNLHTGKLENLSEIKNKIEFYQTSILSYSNLREIVKNTDGVFHEAALTTVQESFEKKKEYWEVNVNGSENVFKLAKDFNLKVVFASSSSVYGNTTIIPIKEEFERKPLNPYGNTKLEAELLAEKYSKADTEIIGLRYFNAYGKGQNPSYAGVITKFMERIQMNKPPIINGGGKQIRDFVFVEDIAKANVNAMLGNVKNGFFNIGTGTVLSILDLANMMVKFSELSINPIYDPPLDGDIEKSQADISLAKSSLKWKPEIKLQDWLKDVIPRIVKGTLKI